VLGDQQAIPMLCSRYLVDTAVNQRLPVCIHSPDIEMFAWIEKQHFSDAML